MIKPAQPKDEKARITALKKLNIIDTPTEKQYDNITELAAYICGAPIALITLIGEDRQFIISSVGTDICKIPREESFCGHAILEDKTLIEAPDTRLDERFKNNPFTTRATDPLLFYTGYPLHGKNGHALGTLCVLDYKPRRLDDRQKHALRTLGNQVERLFELRIKNNDLEQSESDLNQHIDLLKNFAGNVSHDLKMPLSNIIMTIDILKKKYGETMDETGREYLDRLKQAAFGMSDYISNILAYYETENVSSEDVTEEPFGLKEFLEGIIDMLNIKEDCEINLPDKNFDLVCNRYGLEQILLNLLGNSLKYNDKEKTIITIDCEDIGDFYRFTLTDNGMGIPEKEQDKIFNLFTTAAEKDRHGKRGSGIGLSTVKKLVTNLGGQIDIDSEVGEFTTFTFTIKKPKTKV